MTRLKYVILQICNFVMYQALLPVAKWGAGDALKSASFIQHGAEEYTQASVTLNPLTLQRALDDIKEGWQFNAETLQAELNGCMEGLRPKMSQQFQGMMGSLVGTYPPAECFTRVLANAVQLGMYVQRRISKGSESPSQQSGHGERPETSTGPTT